MDLVYSLGTGSHWDNNEIRYSLRSVEKFLKVDYVYVIGECPSFLNVYHIPLKESSVSAHNKQYNIFAKIMRACQTPTISKDFIYMADDHFWLKPVDRIPYYHNGNLFNTWIFHNCPSYQRTLMNTYNELLRRGLPTVNFNIHYPIVYNKEKFLQTVPLFRWGMYHGYAIKSLYCNSLKIEGECGIECKIKQPFRIADLQELTFGKELFSFGDEALNDSMKQYLQQLYPKKSRWEI